MRDPHRWRTIGFWCLGLGVLSFAWLWMGGPHTQYFWAALFFFGALGGAFGFWIALFGHQDVRAKEALAPGEGVLARWRVDAEDWQRFVAADPA